MSEDARICIWCSNVIDHSFDIPLCVPCLVKIHHITTDGGFDTHKVLQDYLTEKIGKKAKHVPSKKREVKKQ